MESHRNLIGTWTLMSCVLEDVETKQQEPVWGSKPNGYLVATSAGRWIVIQTAEGRRTPSNDQDRIAAFKSLLAYSGRYQTDGDRIVIMVDIAADESWTGTQQVRLYRINGDELHIEAPPQRYANSGDRLMRGILVWKRE
jgi:hypothetical protein